MLRDKGRGLHLPKGLSNVNGSPEPDAAVNMSSVRTEDELPKAISRPSTLYIADCALQTQNEDVSNVTSSWLNVGANK